MKRIIFVVALALGHTPLYAQHSLSASLNGGIGTSQLITDLDKEIHIQSDIEGHYLPTFSVEANYAYSFKNWGIESGVGLAHIQGYTKETFHAYNIFNEFEYMAFSVDEKRMATYVQVPLRVKYAYKKVSFAAGVYAALHITDASEKIFYRNGMYNGFEMSGNRLSGFDLGSTARVQYRFSDKWGAQLTANYGFTDVSNGNQQGAKYTLYQIDPAEGRELRNRQFMLGVSYTFI